MLDALASSTLQLNNPDYSSLEDYELEIVAQYIMNNKGTGYESRDQIQEMFDEIIQLILEDWSKITEDARNLRIGYSGSDRGSHVTLDITLPTCGPINGSTITWESKNPLIISNSGQVTRPSDDTMVSLTAFLSNRYEHRVALFNVIVKGNNQ
ncbi:UNVERIFIED_CONTAM: hypothetical protein ABID98_003179 [Brevibacillus sp. OAP136]